MRVVLGFFGRLPLNCFHLGFLAGWFARKGLAKLILDI